jgi:DNA-binding beta-propeller fold protein YncE
VIVAAGAAVVALVLATLALGAAGDLTPQGCIADDGDPAGCGTTEQGLSGAGGIAVSPDGRSVYVGSVADNAIVRFDRDPATGALTPAGCIADVGDFAGCGTTEQGLFSAFGVVVTSDGRSVYVAGEADSAVVRFDRDPDTGALDGQGCIEDPDDPAGCATAAEGLRNARGVAASADGSSVYAVSSDPAIVRFDRDPETGSIAPIGCISDSGDPAGCGTTQQGLAGAQGVTVAPDGRSVYVAAAGDDAIVRFDRDPVTLALTPAGCISDAGDPAGCGATAEGLEGARDVAVTADGRSVYVAAETDDAIVRFERDPATGALTPAGCIADLGDAAGCGAAQQGLDGARGIALAADGRSVYVASGDDNAIVRFDRNSATGALTDGGCIADAGDAAGCGVTQQGLAGARNAAVGGPEGGSVYVTASADNALTRFDRDSAPTLTLSAKRRQRSPKAIAAKASCDVACTVEATGTIRVPRVGAGKATRSAALAKPKKLALKGARVALEAGETARLKLKNKRKGRKKTKRALKAGKAAKAAITATATDAFGKASAPARAKVKVRK